MPSKSVSFSDSVYVRIIQSQPDGKDFSSHVEDLIWAGFAASNNTEVDQPEEPSDRQMKPKEGQ